MEYTLVFCIGAAGYSLLETLWRGYTHWSMTITGGVCFLLVYFIHIFFPAPAPVKILLCGGIITSVELLVGLLVNRHLGWHIWDYSNLRLQAFGQISLLYSLLWTLLSIPLLPLCRVIHAIFSEISIYK